MSGTSFTFLHFTDAQFQKIEGKRCDYFYQYETFSDITSAEERCRRDSSCKGVYYDRCDDSTDDVHLCVVGREYIDSTRDCIYDKKGKF